MRFEQLLSAHALRHPDNTSLVCGERRLSFAELRDSARRLAAGLIQLGIRPGDKVGIHLPNGVEFIQAFYAIHYAGGVVVPLSTWLTLQEVAHACEDSRAKLLFVGDERADAALKLFAGADITLVACGAARDGAQSFDALLGTPEQELPSIPDDQDECLILYTSGTTGKPKGAVLSHDNLLFPAGFVSAAEWGVSPEDRFLVAAPLANRTGIGRITNAVTMGSLLVILESFDPEKFASVVEREQITVVGMVPTMCRRLLPVIEQTDGRCPSLRVVLVTGEAFPVDGKKRFLKAQPNARLVSYYGMTEIGAATVLTHQEQFTHAASVGRPALGVEIGIMDKSDRLLPAEDVGEVVLRGRAGGYNIMKGYFERPEATAETIRDGWLRTGDLGRLDAEGYLYIVDRKKDMIVSGGFNIYSKEVEDIVQRLAGVGSAAAVGVPDESFGEAVALFIEAAPGQESPGKDAIIAHCQEHLAAYKKPRHIFYIDAMPRNSIGKILKRELAEKAKAALAG